MQSTTTNAKGALAPILLFLVCSGFFGSALAIPYTFTKIVDSPFRAASMNNLGEVAYLTGTEIFLSDGTTAVSLSGLAPSIIPPLPPPDGQGIVLNDAGSVAYHCISDQSCRVNRDGTVSGGIPSSLSSPSMNSSGEVPYIAAGELRVANPTSGTRRIYGQQEALQNGLSPGGIPDAPAINDSGEVLFSAAGIGGHAYLVSDGVNSRQVGPNFDLAPNPFEAYGLNNLGTVIGRQFIAGTFDSLLLFYSNGSSAVVVDSSQFASFFPFGLNDLDELVFYGREAGLGGASGIYKGSKDGFLRVIGEGDDLLGLPILSINLIARDALNNKGQIAFAATTSEGAAIYRADPRKENVIPEPTTLVLSFIGLAVILSGRERIKGNPQRQQRLLSSR